MSASYEVRGAVAVITLNNPPVNGLGFDTRVAISTGVERAWGDQVILVVANLAATARAASVTLPERAGWSVRDVFGGAQFAPVGADGSMSFTLGSRDFYWLELSSP